MRKVQARVVAVVVGVALSAPVAFAQTATPPAAKPAPAVAQAPAPARVPLSIARGVVKSIADTRLVIDLGQGAGGRGTGPSTFTLYSETQIQRLGRPLTAKDLRVGDAVTVGYQMRGDKAVASRVWLRFGGATAGTPGGARPQPR
jgi:hypothetical protein